MTKFIVSFLSIIAILSVLGAVVLYALLWIEFHEQWPPEHVYAQVVAPDGASVALFSVRYRGLRPWFPVDVEPHAYVTIVDTRHGAVLVRATEYHGELRQSFAELARKHAPWAGEAVATGPWPD